VLAYERGGGGDRRAVLVNFSIGAANVTLDGTWMVEVDSGGASQGTPFAGRILGNQALVLRPAPSDD